MRLACYSSDVCGQSEKRLSLRGQTGRLEITDEDKTGQQVLEFLPLQVNIWTGRWVDQDSPDAALKGSRGGGVCGSDMIIRLRWLTRGSKSHNLLLP